MAGYVFSVSKDGWDDICENCIRKGYFTPYSVAVNTHELSEKQRKSRNKVLAATFGDFVTMQPGDNIYFLSNRKIYGIGVATQVGNDCKYDNYPNSSALLPDSELPGEEYLTTKDSKARWVCFFTPSPYFFKQGVDMDDVLRYRPEAFKVLRAFEGLSFIKIDDNENRALKEYISLENESAYEDISARTFDFDRKHLSRIAEQNLDKYIMDLSKATSDLENLEYIKSEMFFESLLLQLLHTGEVSVFGHWDYLSHQIIASPFKPLKYIDKIDIFGYQFSEHYDDTPKLIKKYLIIEMKKDSINKDAISQAMQYVDWVCDEYASGDYSRVEAYVVGDHVVRNLNEVVEKICQRSYISRTHPVQTDCWQNLHLVEYSIDETGVHFNLADL